MFAVCCCFLRSFKRIFGLDFNYLASFKEDHSAATEERRFYDTFTHVCWLRVVRTRHHADCVFAGGAVCHAGHAGSS